MTSSNASVIFMDAHQLRKKTMSLTQFGRNFQVSLLKLFYVSLKAVFSSCRYNHDSSETEEDNIEFTATDGTNSVSFVLQVKVNAVVEINSIDGMEFALQMYTCHGLIFLEGPCWH